MNRCYTERDIEDMPQRFRVNFVNSLSGFKSINLVGTVDESGHFNVAPFSSVIHLGADPALVGMITRPDGRGGRHTFDNIQQTGVYTLNHVSETSYRSAHQCSARYPRDASEFDQVDLTPIVKEGFAAPFVEGAPVQVAVSYIQAIPIELNGTSLIIGEIKQVYVDDDFVAESGYIDIEGLGSLTCSGLDGYHLTQKLSRLSYAKPGIELEEIDD